MAPLHAASADTHAHPHTEIFGAKSGCIYTLIYRHNTMQIGLLFWVLMVIWLVFWGWGRTPGGAAYWPSYNGLLLWVLFFLCGWKIFGFILQ